MDAKWIEAALQRTGKTQADLARHLKLAPPIVNKIVKGRREIKAREAEEIRAFFGERSLNGQRDVRYPSPTIEGPTRRTMPEDIPVLGTALGGETGADFTLNGESGMRVKRPPRLEGRVDIFALFVQGESMSPRYMPGELIYLEKARPPQIGDHVVVEMKPGADGTQEAYLKRLVAITPTKVKLAQYSPERGVELDRKKVLQIIRVMTLSDLLGS
jgi:phage repressor protein C with HTH and peptisase S24 domain